jgi:hypothetical protein
MFRPIYNGHLLIHKHEEAIVDRPKLVAGSVINTIRETIASCVRLYTHRYNYTCDCTVGFHIKYIFVILFFRSYDTTHPS